MLIQIPPIDLEHRVARLEASDARQDHTLIDLTRLATTVATTDRNNR